MDYVNLIARFAAEIWAIEPAKLEEICQFLAFKADGGMLSTQEVEARVLSARREREMMESPGKVAILPVHGLIMPKASHMRMSESGTPLDAMMAEFRRLLANDDVKAIIMEHDSPGGRSDGLDEAAAEIHESRGIKPILAHVNTLSASASYYLASQADELIVSPSGRAGSIGVYTVHEDLSRMMEMRGIKREIIRSGPNKAAVNPFGPLSEASREKLQGMVMHANGQFVSAVARGRKVSKADVNEKFGGGDMFDPPELLKRGMVDRIASMKDTLARFGVNLSPAKKTQASAARSAIALGQIPDKSDFEALLRETCGASKTIAAALATGLAAGSSRSESGDNPANRSESGGRTGPDLQSLNRLTAMAKELAATAKR